MPYPGEADRGRYLDGPRGGRSLRNKVQDNDASVGGLDELLTICNRRDHRRDRVALFASIGRIISKPLADLQEVTDRFNKGDLTTAAEINRRDER